MIVIDQSINAQIITDQFKCTINEVNKKKWKNKNYHREIAWKWFLLLYSKLHNIFISFFLFEYKVSRTVF